MVWHSIASQRRAHGDRRQGNHSASVGELDHTRAAASIAAEVRQGTRRDAVLYSVGANAAHGLPRSNADKRRAVETLLRDEEWARWSDREIARRAGVNQSTVSRIRSEIAPSDALHQIDAPRLVQRGGSVYEQASRAVATPPAPRPPPLPFAAQPPWPVVELDPDDADDDVDADDNSPAEVVSVAHLDDADADDEGEDMSPLDLPAPRIVTRGPDLSRLDGADPPIKTLVAREIVESTARSTKVSTENLAGAAAVIFDDATVTAEERRSVARTVRKATQPHNVIPLKRRRGGAA